MTCIGQLVDLVNTVSGWHKNALGRGSASSRYITKLEQSTFLLDIYGLTHWQGIEIDQTSPKMCMSIAGTLKIYGVTVDPML